MRLRTRTALGVDIGVRRINLALVERSEQGYSIVAAVGSDLPTGEAGKPESAPGKVLSRLVAQLGGRARFHGVKAALALPPDSMAIQLLDLPKHVPTNIGEYVKSELQQYVALSGKEIVSDFCGVGPGTQKRLLAVAADVDEIQGAVHTCAAVGITVEAVEPSPVAYARALRELQKEAWQGRDSIIAMLGPRVLTISLLHRGILDFVRLRHLPPDASTPAVLCRWLAEELRAVMRYCDIQASPARQGWQTRVVIRDGMHHAAELASLLGAEAGIRALTVVDACEPWAGRRAPEPDAPAEGVSLVAVGTALAVLGEGSDDLGVNLLPPTVMEARSLFRHVLTVTIVGIALFLGVFLTTQFLTRTTSVMDRRIEQNKLAAQFYATPALVAEEKFLDREISRLQQHLHPLRKALGAKPAADWPGILQAVRQATPANVSLLQLQSADGRTVLLKGLTSSCPAAQAFVQNLENRGLFATVTLAIVQRQQDTAGRLEYRIDCLLKPKGGKTS